MSGIAQSQRLKPDLLLTTVGMPEGIPDTNRDRNLGQYCKCFTFTLFGSFFLACLSGSVGPCSAVLGSYFGHPWNSGERPYNQKLAG
jgi:hypothetical protein